MIVIVGAGIIGVTTAFRLLEKGHTVKIIEKAHKAGTMTSRFNGCGFTPHFFAPLVSKKNVMNFAKSAFSQDFFHLRPQIMMEKNFWPWVYDMCRLSLTNNCEQRNAQRNLVMGRRSFQEYTRLFSTYPELFDFQKNRSRGQLIFFPSQDKLQSFKATLDQNSVDNQIIRSLEQLDPTMINPYNLERFQELKHCLLLTSETSLESGPFTQNLVQVMLNRFPKQFSIEYNCDAQEFNLKDGHYSLQTDRGLIEADKFILAAANETRFIKNLNKRIPLLPTRGWAVSIPNEKLTIPSNSLFHEFNFYLGFLFFAPIDGHIRLGGVASLAGPKEEEWGARILLDQFNKIAHQNIKFEDCTHGQCYRPVTPDDGAIVSQLDRNIYVNTGHGSKGVSQCFGSADIICDVLESKGGGQFNLDRFTV